MAAIHFSMLGEHHTNSGCKTGGGQPVYAGVA